MTKFFVTCAAIATGPESVTIAPTTISPNYLRLEAAQQEALKLAGVDDKDADWWTSESGLHHELHRPNGTWTGYTVRAIEN
jgi:hypothetical protein